MESEGAVTIPQLVESLSQAPPAPAGQRGSNSNVHRTHSHKGSRYYERTRKDLFTDTFCNVCGAVLLFESQRISHYEGKKHAQKVRIYFQRTNEQEPEEVHYKKISADQMTFQMDGNEVSDENKFCKLCSMVFSSAVVAQSHYVGKIHAKKLKNLTAEQAALFSPAVTIAQRIVYNESDKGPRATATKSNSLHPHTEKPRQDVKIDLHSLSENAIESNDSDKYCKLCSAQFNNPSMAQEHYGGKRHTRNVHRQRMMAELRDEEAVLSDSSASVGVNMYKCPVCSLTFTSIEMYQSHMQGNKHQFKSVPKARCDVARLQKPSAPAHSESLEPLHRPCHKGLVSLQKYPTPKKTESHAEGAPFPDRPPASQEKHAAAPHEQTAHARPGCAEKEQRSTRPINPTSRRRPPRPDPPAPQEPTTGARRPGSPENLVVNLIKNSKKSYESFQDELADYIKVQKARGLEPKTSLRKGKDCFEDGPEDRPAPEERVPSERRAPFERTRTFPDTFSRVARYRAPYLSTIQRNYLREQRLEKSQPRMKHSAEQHHIQETPVKGNISGKSTADTRESAQHTSSDESSGSYHRERRQKRKLRKEKRHKGSDDPKKGEGQEAKKRKKSIQEAESEKDDSDMKPKTDEMDTANEDTVKHKKEKKCKADSCSDKSSKKHKRDKEKKKKDMDPRTEEEKLWDESILGF
ncbi:lysine-rich coiled-coil protein 1 isoform X2 [Ambystoma mexicanum]|uniref:lysine-rich coiled-coil protein 1 isoform X2 n=1 Tax=Ambystoma mexicanum TaxID=8296 RepID=UPI0037E82EE7